MKVTTAESPARGGTGRGVTSTWAGHFACGVRNSFGSAVIGCPFAPVGFENFRPSK
jgi:hypothetical protein